MISMVAMLIPIPERPGSASGDVHWITLSLLKTLVWFVIIYRFGLNERRCGRVASSSSSAYFLSNYLDPLLKTTADKFV